MNKLIGIISLIILIVIVFIVIFFTSFSGIVPPKNLIFISIDTLRRDHMGVYGYKINTTPSIDIFSKNSYVYDNAYTIYPFTIPSFYTFFTGKEDFLNKERQSWDFILKYKRDEPKQFSTLTEILKKKGYVTGAFVTNPALWSVTQIFRNGFDNFTSTDVSGSGDKSHYASYIVDYQNAKDSTGKALAWLNTNKKKTFFLWVHYDTPHMPYNPPPEFICKIDPKCNLEIYNKLLQSPSPTGNSLKSCTESGNDPATMDLYKNLYDAEILSVDEQIGILLKEIHKLNLDKNSVIVLYGDHGEGFDHNIFGHGLSVYNSLIRIPFIIKVPGSTGRTISSRVVNSDFADLILKDISPPSLFQYFFQSLFPSAVFQSRSDSIHNNDIYSRISYKTTEKISLLEGNYKYILSKPGSCLYKNYTEELYDLITDPGEISNIANLKSDITSNLKEKLKEYNNFSESGLIDNSGGNLDQKLRSIGY